MTNLIQTNTSSTSHTHYHIMFKIFQGQPALLPAQDVEMGIGTVGEPPASVCASGFTLIMFWLWIVLSGAFLTYNLSSCRTWGIGINWEAKKNHWIMHDTSKISSERNW